MSLVPVAIVRAPAHLVLVALLSLAPGVRLLCSGACGIQTGMMPDMPDMMDDAVAGGETAACHEHQHEAPASQAPVPASPDGCRHGGEATAMSPRGLFAALNGSDVASFMHDGELAEHVPHSVAGGHARRRRVVDLATVPPTGRFLNPLRL